MHQHRAQLTSSTADAKPGTGIDAARPGICSTPAAGRPGAANRAPEFRGAWRLVQRQASGGPPGHQPRHQPSSFQVAVGHKHSSPLQQTDHWASGHSSVFDSFTISSPCLGPTPLQDVASLVFLHRPSCESECPPCCVHDFVFFTWCKPRKRVRLQVARGRSAPSSQHFCLSLPSTTSSK